MSDILGQVQDRSRAEYDRQLNRDVTKKVSEPIRQTPLSTFSEQFIVSGGSSPPKVKENDKNDKKLKKEMKKEVKLMENAIDTDIKENLKLQMQQ